MPSERETGDRVGERRRYHDWFGASAISMLSGGASEKRHACEESLFWANGIRYQKLEPGCSRKARSSSLDSRPRIAFRWG